MNFINRCITVRKSITKLNNGLIVKPASNLINKRNFTSPIKTEFDQEETETEITEEVQQPASVLFE